MRAGEALLLLALFGAAVGAPAVAKAAARRRWRSAATLTVEAGALGVRRELADGRTEEVHWDEITEVDVVLADRGPFEAVGGALVVYGDAERGVVVPLDHLDVEGLVSGLSRLRGFDMQRFDDAIRSRPPRRLSIWKMTPQ